MTIAVASKRQKTKALRQRLDADSVLSAIAINTLTLAMPIAMMQVFDRVIPNQSYGTLVGIFVALLAVLAIDFIMKVSRASFVLQAANQHGQTIRLGLSDALFDGNGEALSALGAETTIEKVMGLLGLRRTENEQVVKLVIDHIFSGLFLIIIWAIAGWIAIIPICVMAFLLVIALWSAPQFRQASQHQRDYKIRRMSFLSEVLSHAQLIKLHVLEQPMLRRYEMLHGSMSVASNKIVQLHGLCYGAASVAAQIVTVLTCAFGGVLAIEGVLTIAELAACMLLTNRAVQPVIQLAFLTSVKDDANQRTEGLSDVVQTMQGHAHSGSAKISGDVNLDRVSLRLPGSRGYRFCDVTLSVNAGALVVIDGPMASQPASLLKILAGEINPDSGHVEIDGCNHRMTEKAPPEGLVFEPREPVILDGSILENLAAFDPSIDKFQTSKIAQKLGLAEQIARLPGGIRTQILTTHRGVGSPGFYKRISLCRALTTSPRVLLLEDPIAFLDPAGQTKLEAALLDMKGDVTVILTRPSQALLEAADHVLNLVPSGVETELASSIENMRGNANSKNGQA